MALGVGAAVLGGSAIGAIGNIIGGSSQGRAIDRASRRQQDFQNRLLDFQRMIFEIGQEQGAPFREAAIGALPGLINEVNNPTLSAGFDLASREGLEALRNSFTRSGDPNSGPAQTAGGRFMAGLLAAERDRQINNAFRLAGFGGDPSAANTRTAAQLFGPLGQSVGAQSGLDVTGGAVRGGTISSIGNTIAQLPFLASLQNLRGTTSPVGASTAGAGGLNFGSPANPGFDLRFNDFRQGGLNLG